MSILNSQVKYNRFYDSLRKYAQSHAKKLGLGWEAVDTAMDKFVDYLIDAKRGVNESLAQEIIANSLKDSLKTKRIDVIEITEDGDIICQRVSRKSES